MGRAGIDWYQVNEIFTSVQGEGYWIGVPATFIRLQGCTVGCPWCDSGPLADEIEGKRRTNGLTANTWGRGGVRMTIAEIFAQVVEKHVIITGGEPTLWNLDALINELHQSGHYVQLETSGQNDLKGDEVPDWVTWSPKENLGWAPADGLAGIVNEVKWVVDTNLNWEVIWTTWMKLSRMHAIDPSSPNPHPPGLGRPLFSLMPEGCPPGSETISKTLSLIQRVPWPVTREWRVTDRLQYRLNVR